MGKRAIGGTTCPQCKQYANILVGRVLGSHRKDTYYLCSNRREHCPYSGGTIEDAIAGITPLRRKTIDRLAREAETNDNP